MKIDFKNIKRFNLSYLEVSNKTYSCGKYDMPYLTYLDEVYPDYLCLYSQKKDYLKTNKTFVCFYQFDDIFDGKNGLFNAIYYNDKKRLEKFKDRFKNVFGFISPDYSQAAEIHLEENRYRCFKSRIVANWLITECNAVVIPNIAYIDKRSKEYCFDGIEKQSIVAISTKGLLKGNEGLQLLKETIKETVDEISPKAIVVYSVSTEVDKIKQIFKYASDKGVEIIIPNNILYERNKILKEGSQYGKN